MTFVGTFRPKNAAEANNIASGETSSPAFVYANDAKMEFKHWIDVPAKANGRSGVTEANGYGHSFYTYVTAAGTLDLGVIQDAWYNGYMWCPFGQFTLTYYTDQVADADISALVATIPSTDLTTAMASELSTKQSTLESDKTIAAYNALQEAINRATDIQEVVRRFNTVKSNVLALKSQTTKFTDRAGDASFTALDGAASTQQTAVNAATTTAPIETAIINLRRAASTFAGSVTLVTGQYIDLTDALLYDADLRDGIDGNLGQWTIDSRTDGSFPKHTNHRASEFWQCNFEFHQTAYSLPAGNYNIEVYAFHRAGTYNTYLYAKVGETVNKVQVLPITNGENSMDEAANSFDAGLYLNSLVIELDATADVNIGFKNEDGGETDKWTIFRDFKIKYFGNDALAVYRDAYEEALDAAEAALDNPTYSNVGGTDRSNLYTAVNTTYPKSVVETGETQEKFETATSNLLSLTTTFKNGVTSWNNYTTARAAAVTEKEKADAISSSIHATAIPTATTASEAASLVSTLNDLTNTIKVEVYDYVETSFPVTISNMDAVIGDWSITGTDSGAENTGSHWDGTTTSKYLEQSGGATGWGSDTGWNLTFSRDVTLPAGSYVLKLAGRHSANVEMTVNVKKKSDSSALGTTINDFPTGGTGRGITTSGAADFATGEGHTYANTNGAGWQWRYIGFTLAAETEVTVSVNGTTTSEHQWMSFCNGEIHTNTVTTANADALITSVDDVDGEIMEGSVQTALTTAKTNLSNDKTNTSKYSALKTAIANAQTSINAYTSAKAYLDRMETALDNNNFYTTAAYNDKYGTWKSGYDARTLATATAAALNADLAYQAGVTYQEANYLDDILLSAWTIGGEQCAEFTKGLVINTWSTEGDADGSEFVKPFYQYWVADAESLAATTIVGTKTGLTASSNYLVRLRARVRQTNGQTKVANSINLTVGSGESIDLTSGDQVGASQFYVDDLMAVGSTDGSGNLTVTINVAADSHVSWLSFRDVKYYSASDLVTELNALKTTATTLLGSGDYENITCYERTNLTTLKNKANPASVSDLVTDINNLKAAIAAFQAGQADYVLLATEKTKAENLNVETATINTCLTEPAADAIKALKVAEYNYVVTNYNTTITLGDWTTDNAGDMNSQHWDGTNSTTYNEQLNGWATATAWTTSYTQDIELPTGQYVFKVAGRHSEASTLTLSVTDVTDGENPVPLGSISDFPVGDTGRGIDTSGATNFSDSGTYSVKGDTNSSAVGGGGTGWEWRYVPFLLDNGEDMATIRISVVGANPDAHQYQWVGFCNYTVQSAPSVAASTVRYNQALAAATAARDNATYANVGGTDRSNLLAAIADTPDPASIAELDAAADALIAATETFTAGVASWNSYVANRALTVAEKDKADAISTTIYTTLYSSDPIPAYTSSTTASDAATLATTFDTMTKALKVGEYNYVIANYTTSVMLGDWEQEGGTTFNYGGQHWSGDASRGYWEQTGANYGSASWNISFHQSITLPAGDYIFKVAGRHAAGGDVTMSLNVTDITDEEDPDLLGTVNDFPASATGKGIDTSGAANFGEGTYSNSNNGNGWEWRYVPFTLAAETEVKVAVTASATATGKWISFCDYEVRAIPNVAISTIAYNQAKDAAEAARDNATYTNVQGTDRSNLLAAIAAEKGSTPGEIDAATENLRAKTTTFTSGVASWNAYAASKVPVPISELPYASTSKWSTLTTAVNATVNTAAEAASQATAINNANRLYVESNAMAEGVNGAVDVTSKLVQPNAPATYAEISGWTRNLNITSGDETTMDVRNNEQFTQGNGTTGGPYYDGGDLWGTTAYTMDFYQNVNLNPGRYLLTVTSRASVGLKTFQLYADGNAQNLEKVGAEGNVFGGGWNDQSLEFSFEGDPKDVKLGLNIEMDATHNWWSANRFRLVQLEAYLTLDESVAYTPERCAARVTLNRTFNSNWATFVVPFDIDNTTLRAKFGDDVQVSEFSHNEKWAISFEPMETPAITANTPVLMKTSTDASSFTFSNVIIKEDNIEEGNPIIHVNPDMGIDVIGHYGGKVSIPGDDGDYLYYYIASNKMKHSTGKQTIKGYRAYFKAEDSADVKAFFEGLDFGDLETGIKLANSEKKEDVIYNLSGQRVSKTQKGGIYIVNGKKVLVK